MTRKKLLTGLLLFCLSGALPAFCRAQADTAASYRKLSDVKYGDDRENTMDAYLPSDYEQARVIVYIHGGGWTGGDKSEFPVSLVRELVGKRGYIVVSMNYRLVRDGQNHFPAQIEDISKLLDFIDDKAGKYHYRAGEFLLMGGSAGAHLAMLYAYGYDSAKQVKGVVDFWGPTDLSDKDVRENNKAADEKVVNLLGVTDTQAPLCLAASPYLRVTKESGVPTLLFHGGEDPLVAVGQAEKMYRKLQSLNIPAQLEIYPHEKHGLSPTTAADAFGKTLAWLEKYYPAKPAPTTYAEKLGFPKGSKVIILHVDDAGMSVNSNDGAVNSIEKGVATSTSIMMPCPWAASFAKYAASKGYDAGLHLTLTSEWENYRWPPLCGAKQVPGLVDSSWCLWHEVEDVVAHATADEVEREIRAQVGRALSVGLRPTHLDSHMGTLFASQAFLERYIKVGVEYGIPVMFPGGNNKLLTESFNQPLIKKLKAEGKYQEGKSLPVPAMLKNAGSVGISIWNAGLPVLDDLVTYSGDWTPEPVHGAITPQAYAQFKVKKLEETIERMQPGLAMYIVHSTVLTNDFRRISASGESRYADMNAMMSPDLKRWLSDHHIILTTWREVMQRRKQVGNSRSDIQSPAGAEYLAGDIAAHVRREE